MLMCGCVEACACVRVPLFAQSGREKERLRMHVCACPPLLRSLSRSLSLSLSYSTPVDLSRSEGSAEGPSTSRQQVLEFVSEEEDGGLRKGRGPSNNLRVGVMINQGRPGAAGTEEAHAHANGHMHTEAQAC